MRVDRAVDKLRDLLARRGVTSSAAALSLALANQAVVAAPAGLAATVTGAALAGTGTTAALTFMSFTKLQLGLASAVLATGAGLYTVQEHDIASLHAELAALPQSDGEIASLRQSNRELAQAASHAANLQTSDAELARLHDEAVALQRQLQATAQPVPRARPVPPAVQAFSIKDLDRKPTPTFLKAPSYPAEMRAAGIAGTVVVSMVIDSTGKVQDVRAVESTHHAFEAAAVAAVSEWQFDPGLHNGQKVNTRVSQMLQFQTDRDSATAGDWF
jgi:TonB family protein